MTIEPVSAIHPRLINYTPKSLTPVQWAALRDRVCLLVSQAEPRNDGATKPLASNLCQLLAAELDGKDEAKLEDLFTGASITRHMNRISKEYIEDSKLGMRKKYTESSRQIMYTRLKHLYKVMLGFPANQKVHDQPAAESSELEVKLEQIKTRISQAPVAIRGMLDNWLEVGLGTGQSPTDIGSGEGSALAVALVGEGVTVETGHLLESVVMILSDSPPVSDISSTADVEFADAWWRESYGPWPIRIIRHARAKRLLMEPRLPSDVLPEIGMSRNQLNEVIVSFKVDLSDHHDVLRGFPKV
jgi:hypothetical protein